jgi:glc operon protein GlcG
VALAYRLLLLRFLFCLGGVVGCLKSVCLRFSYFSNLCLMKTKHFLESADVKAIAAAAEAEALKHNWAVTIAIVDDGGHLLGLQRLDGAPAISSYIAPAKANTAALGRRESKVYEDVINAGRMSFLSAPEIKGMLEGGVPIVKDGQFIGAVGVSGVKSNEDAQIAKAGIAAIGL